MYHYTASRSAIPKVIGILMIIFASLGLVGTLIGFVNRGPVEEMVRDVPELRTWNTMQLLFGVVGLGIGALHLYAGVRCLGYKANAPRLARAYAIATMAFTILNTILVFAWAKPLLEKALGNLPGGQAISGMFGFVMILGLIFSLAWPTIVLVLMSRPTAKAACVNEL